MRNILSKLKESAITVLPIAIIVIVLSFTLVSIPLDSIIGFIIGCALVIIGLSLFGFGADSAMIPIGQRVGSTITRTRKLPLIIAVSLIIGIIITIAEPNLTVLAESLDPTIAKAVLIVVVAAGMGVFLVLAMLRIVLKISLRLLLIISYSVIFIMAIFAGDNFLPLAFDSGGMATGPMTVPFIMALGIGVAATNGSGETEDSFGLVALCAIGPIIAVLLLGLFTDTASLTVSAETVSESGGVIVQFLHAVLRQLKDVAIALFPIAGFFIVFRVCAIRNMPSAAFWRIVIGIVYAYIGLVIFMTGINVGFKDTGALIGRLLAEKHPAYLIPIGVIIGFLIVGAEPSVQVLNQQVEEVSGGTIKRKHMMISLMIGVAVSVGLSMVRVVCEISIWWLILPGYVIALTLSFLVPKIYTAIAFDSGCVASGPMTATFLLPLTIGAASALGRDVLTYAYGMVAMVSMTPVITIQILGLVSTIRVKQLKKKAVSAQAGNKDRELSVEAAPPDAEIIELE